MSRAIVPGPTESVDQARARMGMGPAEMPAPQRPVATDNAPRSTIVDMLKDGDLKMTGQAPTNQGADTTKALAEGGQILSQGPAIRPVVKSDPAPTGGSGNLGGTSGFPAAGMGQGGGMVTKPGVTGKTLGRPHGGPGGFPGSSGGKK
jgi:hypothetical protein